MEQLGPDDLDWLCGPEGGAMLDDLRGQVVTPSLIGRLRKTLSPAQAAALVQQIELRTRAKQKFRQADQMFFTRQSLEQATDEWVAKYKASRFLDSGTQGPIYDFCTGAAGDLIGLAQTKHRVIGYECDPMLARFAQENVACYSSSAEVICEAVDEQSAESAGAWHADPDRRPTGRRTTTPDLHEPPLEVLEAWLRLTPAGAVKFAPAAQLPESWVESAELEWISREGSCRQLVAWHGDLASQPGQRTATRVLSGTQSDEAPIMVASFTSKSVDQTELVEAIDRYLFDPDPALLAAGLHWALAEKRGIAPFSGKAAYLTGSKPIRDPLLACFEVREIFPLDRKRLAGWLGEHEIGRLEIKCRGVDLRPEKLRADLRPRGDREATLIVAPAPGNANKPCVIVAKRVPLSDPTALG